MTIRSVTLAGVGLAALAAATTLVPAAGASGSPLAPSHVGTSGRAAHFSPTKLGTCVDQSDNDTRAGIVSQNFDTAYDTYDSRAADDFTLQKNCRIKMIMVDGQYFNGSGVATSENVTFYRDMAGVPGGVISNQLNLKGEDDGSGNLTIKLSSPVGLTAGTYWVSVQANLAYGTGGEWGWNTNTAQRGNPGVWRNKPDGFGTGCIHFTVTTSCLQLGQGPDFSYMLHGSGPGSH